MKRVSPNMENHIAAKNVLTKTPEENNYYD